jgi:hypothetical protein
MRTGHGTFSIFWHDVCEWLGVDMMYTKRKKTVITFTVLSSPPDTTQRPSGVNLIALTPRVWPLYV